MAITSNLKAKGLRVEGGTTLFVLPAKKEREEKLTEWTKTKISFHDHKVLKGLAIDREITLDELYKGALKLLLKRREMDK